jgi:hypothetical protein
MFAVSSEVGIFSQTICIAHNYCLYSEFVRGKLALVHFQSAFSFKSAFSFHGALFHPWHFISFMALYFSCIALYSNILSVSQHFYIFSKCALARYLFLPPNCHAAIILIS